MEKFLEALICLDDAIHGNGKTLSYIIQRIPIMNKNNLVKYIKNCKNLNKLKYAISQQQRRIHQSQYFTVIQQCFYFYPNCANFIFSQKDCHEVLNICDLAINKNVTNAEIYQCKGQIFYTWKQMDECRKNYKNAIRESSCSPVVYREFAFVLTLFKVTQKRLQNRIKFFTFSNVKLRSNLQVGKPN